MRAFTISVTLICLISMAFSAAYPKSQDQYFEHPFTKKHLISVMVDTTKNPYGKKLVDRLVGDLEKLEVVKQKNIEFAVADLSEISMLRSHYKIDSNFVFFYYINNRLQKFGDFAELAENFINQTILYPDFLEKVSVFIREKVNRINAPISTTDEFLGLLEKHKIMAVYIGKPEGFFFNQYQDFAEKNIDFDFFHAKDSFVSDVIYYHGFQLPRPQNEVFFGIARHQSLLNEFDSKPIVVLDGKKSSEELRLFFDFERYPKLRDESTGEDSFFKMFNKNEKMILYVKNDQSPVEEKKEFLRAVYMMPKMFIFTEVSTKSSKWGAFMQMFIHANSNPMEDRVYIITAAFGELRIQMIPAQIVADKIIEGVQRFYQQNRGIFSELERSIFDGPQTEENQIEKDGEETGELVYQEL